MEAGQSTDSREQRGRAAEKHTCKAMMTPSSLASGTSSSRANSINTSASEWELEKLG
jgi:hypothetical protein